MISLTVDIDEFAVNEDDFKPNREAVIVDEDEMFRDDDDDFDKIFATKYETNNIDSISLLTASKLFSLEFFYSFPKFLEIKLYFFC